MENIENLNFKQVLNKNSTSTWWELYFSFTLPLRKKRLSADKFTNPFGVANTKNF